MPILIEELTAKKSSIFKTVLALAERATEISSGKNPLVKAKNKRPSTVAMEEFGEKKVTFEIEEAEEA
jgi:DNA-directed RNA polymerase subunit K/omega